jgi:hypothetical protein
MIIYNHLNKLMVRILSLTRPLSLHQDLCRRLYMMMRQYYYYMNLLRKLCTLLHELHYKIQLHKV